MEGLFLTPLAVWVLLVALLDQHGSAANGLSHSSKDVYNMPQELHRRMAPSRQKREWNMDNFRFREELDGPYPILVGEKLHRRMAPRRQKRDWIIDTFTLQEELPGPYPLLVGQVKLESNQLIYNLQGKGVDEDPKGLFHINEEDGSIYVHQKIDFETTPIFKWSFNAINKTSRSVGTRLGIHLKIIDINDNAPEFKNKSYSISVNESMVQGTTVFTLLAYDKDDESSPNSEVSYILTSQTPTDPNVEFTIDKGKGFISFKGCLRYEAFRNYKLVVEARDNGEKIQQSSTCTVFVTVIDKNTVAPRWNSPELKAQVPENQSNVTILRFGIEDDDTPFTPAWRAVYSIVDGNDDENYQIITDPKTNEGMLNVIKPLDYESKTQNILSISVANEEPLYTCKIIKKPSSGRWVVESEKLAFGKTGGSITVDILDVNDPPKFKPEVILVTLVEHSHPIGEVLVTVQAKDYDVVLPNNIKYHLVNDTGDWLSIHEDTGVITTKGQLDREADYVYNSKYIVIIHAVDDGVPPMTGTATLIINMKDINDNIPSLKSAYLTTCENDEEAFLNTPIVDRDLDPYSGPFFVSVLDKDPDKKPLKLLNYDDDIIKVKKEKEAYQGNHTIHLEIYDRQGVVSFQNLTVYVCECLGGEVCIEKMADPPGLSGGAIALLLLVPVIFLLLSLLLCKIQTAKVMVPVESEPLNSMIVYNEEAGNKDCQAAAILSDVANMNDFGKEEVDGRTVGRQQLVGSAPPHTLRLQRSHSMQVKSFKSQTMNRMAAGASTFDRANRRRHSSYQINSRYGSSIRRTSTLANYRAAAAISTLQRKQMKTLEATLIQKLTVHKNETEIDKPRVYAEEGDLSRASSLETISMLGSFPNLSSMKDLGSKFNILENLCEEHMNLQKTDPEEQAQDDAP